MSDPIQYPVRDAYTSTDKVFQYPRPKRTRIVDNLQRPRTRHDEPSIGPERWYIQGLRASREEYIVYQSLLRAGFRAEDIRFQVGFLGGRNFRGGFVVDFVLNTKPLPTPIWVHGEYWHTGQQRKEDFMQQARLRSAFPGQFNPPVELFGVNLVTEDTAFFAVLEQIGTPV